MYDIFEQLLQSHGISAYKFCKETGVSQSTISTWKKKNSKCGMDLARIVANYFNVTIDYLMTGGNETRSCKTETPLNSRDERDIAKRLENTLNALEDSNESLMFSGEPLDDETRELLKASLENSLKIAKINAKQKFTPKKYRNDNE